MAENIPGKPVKKVLILAYSFPPVGGGRVRRVMKFVKYLPFFNWQPVVLTVKNPQVGVYDHTLLGGLNGDVAIIRTPSLEPNRAFHKGRQYGSKSKIVLNLLYKIKTSIFIPDTRIGWIPFAVLNGISVIKKQRIDVIMVIAEPFSSFISGVILKFFTRKPLVLDFRDEWSENNKCVFKEKGFLVKKAEELLEAMCVRYADCVISVTDGIIDRFRRRYEGSKDKFTCITNGYDPDDFKDLGEPINKNNIFTISYAGALYERRIPKYFFEAAASLVEDYPELKKIMRINFMGEITPEVKNSLENSAAKEIIQVVGFLNFKDALKEMKSSDVLLYVEDEVDNSCDILPAKLFEYMGIRRPVLALVRDGIAKDVVLKSKIGLAVNPKDIGQIKNALFNLYQAYYKNKDKFQPEDDFINRFHRKDLTKKLAMNLDFLYERNKQ